MNFKKFIVHHKNTALFVLLVLSLLATYVFEEKQNIKDQAFQKNEESLFKSYKSDDFFLIEGEHFSIKQEKSQFIDARNSVHLSRAKVDEFLNVFLNLKIERILEQKEVESVGLSNYFPAQKIYLRANFQSEKKTIFLGKKLEYEQSFYMLIETESLGRKSIQYAIVSDPSPDPGVYQTEEEYTKSQAKYQKILSLLTLSTDAFYDVAIFKDFNFSDNQIHFSRVTISTFRNKSFIVSFKESRTQPPPPQGIRYFEENWLSFYGQLTNLSATKIHLNFKQALLNELLSLLEIELRDGKKINLELYRSYLGRTGYFLKTDFSTKLYEINPKDALYFLVNIQDFWVKKLPSFGTSYKFQLNFIDKQTLVAKVQDAETFKVDLDGQVGGLQASVPKTLAFKKLIDFIKSEANQVSELVESDKELKKNMILEIKVDNNQFYLLANDYDLIICDLNRKIKYHHYVGRDLPISIKYSDYL